jgi:hypothetical protein
MTTFVIRFALILILLFVAANGWAACTDQDGKIVDCPPEGSGVLGGGDGGGGSPGGTLGGGGTGGGGSGSGDRGENGDPAAINIPLFSDAIKNDPRFCKKPNESCADLGGWSTRMTAGVPATPTTAAVASVCGRFGPSGQGACNTAVTLEAAELGCANTKAC